MSVTGAAQQMSPLESRTQERASDIADAAAPRVLVSVLNYRGVDESVETIRSLQRQDYPNFRFSCSTTRRPNDSCARRFAPQVPDIEIQDDAARTSAIAAATTAALRQGLLEGYDYVIVCNHDIELAPNAIRRMVETAESRPGCRGSRRRRALPFNGPVTTTRGTGFSFWTGRTVVVGRYSRRRPPTARRTMSRERWFSSRAERSRPAYS